MQLLKWNIRNIELKHIRRVRSSMPTVTSHGSSKWHIQMRARAPLTNAQGWYSLSSLHTLRSHRVCTGLTCPMHPTLSKWPHALPSANPQKGRVRSLSDCNCTLLFFLGYHAAWVEICLDGRTSSTKYYHNKIVTTSQNKIVINFTFSRSKQCLGT
jgi:hypothetical protein